MRTIKQLANLISFERMFDVNKIKQTVVQALAYEGERLINEAYATRKWKNRTHNLRYSYVSFVMIEGKLAPNSTRFLDDDTDGGPTSDDTRYENYGEDKDGTFAIRGRSEANNFIRSYVARHSGSKGIQLVVAAAMYYASILEIHRGYHVISHMHMEAENALKRIEHLRVTPFAGAHHSLDLKLKGVVRRVDHVAEGANTFRFK